jgi:integrase
MAEYKRRGRGEGSIYRLPSGVWRGTVEIGWANGRRQRKTVTRLTRADVSKELRRLVDAAAVGQIPVGRAPTFGEWLDTYLREVATLRVRPSTLARYRQELRLYIKPGLGRHRLDVLKPSHISSFYREQGQRLSAGSVRRLHALIRRSLTIAVRWGLIASNPALLVEPPALGHHEIEPLSLDEARRFLNALEGHRLKARWVIGLALGLRQGEVLGLRWTDVDLDAGVLRVNRALQRQSDGALKLVEPKTARSRRTVPLPQSVVDAMKLRRSEQDAERDKAGALWNDSYGLVFTTAVGTPVHPRNDYRSFRLITDRAGLRRIRVHDLRHTTATLLLAQGVPARVVMEILGHSQISVTLNTYSHVASDLARAATVSIEEALWSNS